MSVKKNMLNKLDYLYRLSAARCAIQRLRITRYLRQRKIGSGVVGTGMLFLYGTVAVGSLSSVVVGYLLGYLQASGATSQAPVSEPVVREIVATATVARKAGSLGAGVPSGESNMLALAPPLPLLLPMKSEKQVAQMEPVQTDVWGEGTHKRDQISALLETVGSLTRKVSSLEEETYSLESELLAQQLDFAVAENTRNAAPVETKVIYNITNVPVGGYVTAEKIPPEYPTATSRSSVPAPEDQFFNVSQSVSPYAVADASSAESLGSFNPYEDVTAQEQAVYQGMEDVYESYNAVKAVIDPSSYVQTREGMGAAELWARDAYLRANVNTQDETYQQGGAELPADPYPYADEPESALPENNEYDGLQSFYGPAQDRHEDYTVPSYASSPFDDQQKNLAQQ